MAELSVVCVGDCGIDHYLPSADRYFGGITANFARHAQDEFADDDVIRIVSCVGNDDGASLVLLSLADSGIEIIGPHETGRKAVLAGPRVRLPTHLHGGAGPVWNGHALTSEKSLSEEQD